MKKSTRVLLIGIALVAISTIALWRVATTVPPEKETFRVVNCVGYCNMPLFIAAESSRNEQSRLNIETVFVGNPAEHVAALTAPNGPIVSVTPFTNALVAYANGADIRIVCGSGVNGLALVAGPDFTGPESLKKARIGTVPGDTLEQLAYAYVKKHGIMDDVNFIYFTDPIKLIQALKSGEVAAITHVEPFVTQLVESDGMQLVARGEEVWGVTHPDCVVITTASAMRSRPDDIKEFIRMMIAAEKKIKGDLKSAIDIVAEPVYRMKPSDLLLAVKSQSPQIDIRGSEGFIMQRAGDLRELGHVSSAPTSSIIDFSLLEAVLEEK